MGEWQAHLASGATRGHAPVLTVTSNNEVRMSDSLDVDAMIQRFRDRAAAVKKRDLPPIGGEERQRFIQQAQTDFQDYAIIGDATASLDDGVLTLTIDLRPSTDE